MRFESINHLAKQIYAVNKKNGFWKFGAKRKNVGEVMMLIASELGEAIDADRKGKYAGIEVIERVTRDRENYVANGLYEPFFLGLQKGSFEDEVADVALRLLDFCAGFKIDIESAVLCVKARHEFECPKNVGQSLFEVNTDLVYARECYMDEYYASPNLLKKGVEIIEDEPYNFKEFYDEYMDGRMEIHLATAFMRLVTIAEWHGFDLQDVMENKLAYNKTRTYDGKSY